MNNKILYSCWAISLLAVIIVFIASVIVMNFNAEKNIKTALVKETELLSKTVDSDNYSSLSDIENIRVTVISLSGQVLLDTFKSGTIENHLERQEVKDALNGTPKTVKRYSETLNKYMYYYALTADDGKLVIRLAVESESIGDYFLGTLPFFFLAAFVALVISYIFARFLSLKISRKIKSIELSLKSLNDGNYKPIDTNMEEPEFFAVLSETNEIFKSTRENLSKIQTEEEKLDFVLDNISQGVIAINSKFQTVLVNKTALNLFNGIKDDINKDLNFLIEDKSLRDKLVKIILAEESSSFEYEREGKIFDFTVTKTDSSDLQNDISHILVISDISKEKELIKQKSEFFSNASHELKTPMTSIQGMAELLTVKNKDGSLKKYIDRIHTESLRINSLIMDMLKLSNLENLATDEQYSLIDLRKTADEVAASFSHQCEQKTIKTTVRGKGKVAALNKDIFELISNIYSNAVNYNVENGRISIDIIDKDDSVEFICSDTGIGIEKEHLPRLCERFYRVDKSRSKNTGGTGLGLAIVKHICSKYNAALSIESQTEKGTTVKVVFKK